MSKEQQQTLVEVTPDGKPVYVDSTKHRTLQKERSKLRDRARKFGLWIRLLLSTSVLALGLLGIAFMLFNLYMIVTEESVSFSDLYDNSYFWLLVSTFAFSLIGWIGIRRGANNLSRDWNSSTAWSNRLTLTAVFVACGIASAIVQFLIFQINQSI